MPPLEVSERGAPQSCCSLGFQKQHGLHDPNSFPRWSCFSFKNCCWHWKKVKWECGTDLQITIALFRGSQGHMNIKIKPILEGSTQVHLFKRTWVAYHSTFCSTSSLCSHPVASYLYFSGYGSLIPPSPGPALFLLFSLWEACLLWSL